MNLTGPRSLRAGSVVSERLDLLHSVRSASPLTEWVDNLIAARSAAGLPAEMPYIDPLDAGVDARVLIILEAPGPMTNANNTIQGSGFISSDNDDFTAENLWDARKQSGLTGGVLLWNAVPWYLGPAKRKPRVPEKVIGGEIILQLIHMLPELHTVVPLGAHAKDTWRRFARPHVRSAIRTVESFHSSNRAMWPAGRRPHLHAALARAASDWRPHASDASASVIVDRDRFGATTNHWYEDTHGDRIDIHPRWW